MPTQTRDQAMEHLVIANRIRIGRAEVKRDIRARRRSLAAVLLDPPECCESALVTELIRAMPRWGIARALKLMHAAEVRPSRQVGNLTMRERTALVNLLQKAVR